MKTWFADTLSMRMTRNVKIIPGRLIKSTLNPLMTQDQPWEKRIDNGYPNVFWDPQTQLYRCYYTCVLPDQTVSLLYAQSADGLSWQKPALGLTKWEGSRDNNILMTYIHGGCVLLDQQEPDPQKRYKLMARDDHEPRRLVTAFSADGIRFTSPAPVAQWAQVLPGDTHNFVMHAQDGAYRFYTRTFNREQRAVVLLESNDFAAWHFKGEVCRGLSRHQQVYAMPVFESGGLYWGLAAIYHGGDTLLPRYDCVDVELTYSQDGENWHFLSPGQSFLPGNHDSYDCGCCFSSVPIHEGNRLRFYYLAAAGTHYGERKTALCLAELDENRLCGAAAANPEAPFVFQTIAMQLNGALPTLCADIAEGGFIRCELLDLQCDPIPGYDQASCRPLTASSSHAVLSFDTSESLPEKAMLRLTVQNAVLYSLDGNHRLLPPHS